MCLFLIVPLFSHDSVTLYNLQTYLQLYSHAFVFYGEPETLFYLSELSSAYLRQNSFILFVKYEKQSCFVFVFLLKLYRLH